MTPPFASKGDAAVSEQAEPSRDALDLAHGILEAAIENGRPWGKPSPEEIALALDRFRAAERERCLANLRAHPVGHAMRNIEDGYQP